MNIVLELARHISDQPSRRHVHLDPHKALLSRIITPHLPLAHRQLLYDASRILFPNQNRALLHRLQHARALPVLAARVVWVGNHDRLGRCNQQLKPFAAERLEEDSEVENATPAELERF